MNFLKRETRFLILTIIISSFLFTSNYLFAYDEIIVHPSLTSEMAKLYNLNYGEKLTDQEIEWMKKGSKDEDDRQGLLIRSGNHFYNPLGIKKWADNTLIGNSVPEPKLTAKEWLHDSLEQDSFPGGDFTWERGIWDYANGDRQHAYESLGHIMHLIEDSTVPAHVRNDLHISPNDKDLAPYQNLPHFEEIKKALQDGEPYEAWTGGKAWAQTLNYNFAENLFQEKKSPIALNNTDEYFDNIAKYTNTKFFSKDTIYAYAEPKTNIVGNERADNGDIVNYVYEFDNDGKKFKLAEVSDKNSENQKILIVDDTTPEIHSDYWSRLAPRAVLTGAGIIKLFKDEANKAAQNPQSIERPKSIASVYGPLSPAVRATDPSIRQIATAGQLLANAAIYLSGKALIAAQNIIISAYNSAQSSAIAFYNWEIANGLLVYNTAQSAGVSAYDSAVSAAIAAGNTVTAAIINAKTQADNLFSSAGVAVSQPVLNSTAERGNSSVLADQNNFQNNIAEVRPAAGESSLLTQESGNSLLYDAVLILNSGQNLKFAPGQEINLNLRIKNIGAASWNKNMISLGAYMTRETAQKFYHPSWLTAIRPASLAEQVLDPGETGNFNFTIKSPESAGDYFFRVRPLWQNEKSEFNWIGSDIASWNIKVAAPENKIAELDAAGQNQIAEAGGESRDNGLNNNSSDVSGFANGANGGSASYTGGGGNAVVADILPPEKISDLAAGPGARRGTIKLSWTAPEENVRYEIRYADKGIVDSQANENEINWENAGIISEAVEAGKSEIEAGVAGIFLPGKKYYFVIKSKDEAGNISDLSNIADSFPNANAEHLVISEIQVSGATADDEFIELYNPTDSDIVLNDYTINKKIRSGADGVLVVAGRFKDKIINTHGYLLLARTDYYKGNIVPDIWWPKSYEVTQDNTIIIYDSQNKIVDKAGFGEASDFEISAFPSNPGNSQSLERKVTYSSTPESLSAGADKFLGNGWDTDNNSADFVLQSAPNPQNSESFTEPRYAPGKINNFSASGMEGDSRAIKLIWSAPRGANGANKDLIYDIRFSESEITSENFNSANAAQNIPPVKNSGQSQELEIKDLALNKIYYFAIKTKDIAGLESAINSISYSFLSAVSLSPWPSYKGGNLRAGQSAYSGPESANLKWKYKTSGSVINSPSVSEDGNIYLWSGESSEAYGNLISLADNQTAGSLNWKSPVSFYFEKTPIIDAEGNIIVGGFNTGGQSLLKINNKGKLQRVFGPPEYAAVYGPIAAKNSETDYFVVFNDGRISARDGNFSQKWESSIMQGMEKKDYENNVIHIWGLPAEDSEGNIYIAAVIQITKREPPRYEPVFDYEKSVYRLISFDSAGNLRWIKDVSKIKRPIAYPEFLSPAIGQNTGYVSAQNNLYAFSLADGAIQWTYSVGEEGGKSYDSSSPSLASDGTVYNIFSDGYLYAFSSSGEHKWKALIMQSEDYASRLPAATIGLDGTIYAGGENIFYAFNPDGSEKWRYSVADDFGGKKAIAGVPAIGKDGTVYVSFGGAWQTSGGMLYAFGR